MKPRIVLDTNVIVDAFAASVYPTERNRAALRAYQIAIERYVPAANGESLREMRYLVHQPRLDRFVPRALRREFLRNFMAIADTRRRPDAVDAPHCDDADDRVFLRLALAHQARYLVTSDSAHLLPLRRAGGTLIVSPQQFVALESAEPRLAVTQDEGLLRQGVAGATALLSPGQAHHLTHMSQVGREVLQTQTLIPPYGRETEARKTLLVTANPDLLAMPRSGRYIALSPGNYAALAPVIKADPEGFARAASAPVRRCHDTRTPVRHRAARQDEPAQ